MNLFQQFSEIQVPISVAFEMACIFAFAVVIGIVIGYFMGRNSAEKPIISEKVEYDTEDDAFTPDNTERDYFSDELPDYEPIKKRVATIR